ncbi:MAG: ABC transporter ATP-binding protein [Pseudomonadota bacterium]
MQWLFGPFERWLDPFKAPPTGDLPDTVVRFLLYFLSQARLPFVAVLAASAVTGFIEAWLYTSVGIIIDALRETDPETIWQTHGWLFAAMAFVVLVLRTVSIGLISIISELTVVPGMFYMTRWQAHRRVVRQSYAFFQDDFAGRIATKVMQSGQAVGDFLLDLIQGILQFLIFGVVAIGLFVALDWRLAVLLAAWFAGYFFLLSMTLGEIRARAQRMSRDRASLNGRLVDSYTNIQTVKLYAGTEREDRFVREAMERTIGSVIALGRYVSGLRLALVSLNGLLMVSAGWLGISLWQSGAISLGALAASLGLVLRLNHMSGWISFQINGLFRQIGTLQDSIETIAPPIGVVDKTNAAEIKNAGGPIVFDQVSFAYGGRVSAVHDLSLRIETGEKVGLIGRSGAGKTTLTNLLLRLYDVEAGRITIADHDIAGVTQDSLRSSIGVVTQDTSLLHRSVRDNIAYGQPDATHEEIISAAQRAQAHDFILKLSDTKGREGYDAQVGERGVKLSGGQRQRIAIARVLLKNAPILILDEATSALDSEVEAAIQSQFTNLMDGKTVIAIAHRLSTIAAMDRLIVMDGGAIVEQGTHEQLVARDGIYAGLWARQSGGFLLDEAVAAE